jgi:hypothetical protein
MCATLDEYINIYIMKKYYVVRTIMNYEGNGISDVVIVDSLSDAKAIQAEADNANYGNLEYQGCVITEEIDEYDDLPF